MSLNYATDYTSTTTTTTYVSYEYDHATKMHVAKVRTRTEKLDSPVASLEKMNAFNALIHDILQKTETTSGQPGETLPPAQRVFTERDIEYEHPTDPFGVVDYY